jgi:quercetin dioxygenase-like cupin family protein
VVRSLDEVPVAASEAPGVAVRKLKRVEDVELKVLDVEVDAATPFHTHGHAHEAVVIAGTGALRRGDGSEPLAAGDVFSVAPGEPHAVENRGAEPLRFVCLDCFITD